ncbi:MAG: hypothetical protein KDB79_16135 [Acidobacteria bacterium]|nr:hypothetical protein [Acidobacteriota bacterium]
MRSSRYYIFTALIAAVVFTMSVQIVFASAAADKLSTEEILAKHLASIGTEEARNSVTSMMSSGTAKLVARGRNAGETAGLVVIASEGEKNLIGMRFDNSEYPYEKMGYDGNEFTVGFLSPGKRSLFGSILRINEDTFKVGVLGGPLSTAWELLNYNEKVGKLKCGGTKKLDGVEHYKCSYDPKKSAMDITMYFDATTFRLARTEYKRVISGGQGVGIDNSARQNESRYTITENFSDYKPENNLTLPHSYVLTFEMLTGNGSTNMEWTMNLNEFTFNQKIPAEEFKVDTF